jgi:hypothetical protein
MSTEEQVLLSEKDSAKLRKLYNGPFTGGNCGFCDRSDCYGHRIVWPRWMLKDLIDEA